MIDTNYEYIVDRETLSAALQVPLSELTGVLYGRGVDSYYYSFEVPKKDGSLRQIDASTKSLKYIQRRLVRLLESRQREVWNSTGVRPNISHAFQREKSIMTNAKIHKNKRYVVNTDLEDFFGSIHFGRVKGFFEKDKYYKLPHEVAIIIAQLACYKGRLPQGAPSSPIITNLICNIMDMRLLRVAKKYKLDYTRYADDLTFSTNNRAFADRYELFLSELNKEVNKAGFKINDKKTRFIYKSSRQEVTGLVVNDKVSVNAKYRKDTRAMVDHLYKTGSFTINGMPGSIDQLEGRLNYIDQIDRFNRTNSGGDVFGTRRRELQYQSFIFFKNFVNSDKPIIITEGPTDVLHLKAALKSKCCKYPNLIQKGDDGRFCYNVTFFKMSRKNAWLINKSDGGDKFRIINRYYGVDCAGVNEHLYGIIEKFIRYNNMPKSPVIMIIDNEDDKNKPLSKVLNGTKFSETKKKEIRDNLNEKGYFRIKENLYFASMPKTVTGDIEIEDLYNEEDLLRITIYGKKYCKQFDKNDIYDNQRNYTKMELAKYVEKHWKEMSFDGFNAFLTSINDIVDDYKKIIR